MAYGNRVGSRLARSSVWSRHLEWFTLPTDDPRDAISCARLALLSKQPGLNQIAELGQKNLLHVIGNNEGWAHSLVAPGNAVAQREADIDVSAGVQFDTSVLALEYAAAGGGIAIKQAH